MKSIALILASVVLIIAAEMVVAPRIERQRVELELRPKLTEDMPATLRDQADSSRVAIIGAALGVFRPLVINVLSLRAEILEKEGRFFESAAITRAITALLPRLPRVWVFQARKLAYDISPEAPAEQSFQWVLEAIELLRDGAAASHLSSPLIYDGLADVFLQKIASREGHAGKFARQRFAAIFEPPVDGVLLAEWKIDPAELQRLIRLRVGPAVSFDLRCPATHAFYWAEIGRALGGGDGSATLARLEHHSALSIRILATRGRVLRQPGGPGYARLPDLRFAGAYARNLRDEAERFPEYADDLAEDLTLFTQQVVVLHAVSGDWNVARRMFESEIKDGTSYADLEGFLTWFLLAREGEVTREEQLDLAIALLRASLHLMLQKESSTLLNASAGLQRFAELLLVDRARRHPGDQLPSLEDLRSSVLISTYRRLAASESTQAMARRLAGRLQLDTNIEAPLEVDISRARRLPLTFAEWELESLDPFAGGSP